MGKAWGHASDALPRRNGVYEGCATHASAPWRHGGGMPRPLGVSLAVPLAPPIPGPMHMPLPMPVPMPLSMPMSIAGPTDSGRPRQRCPDFEERGFCLKGDLCPMDHGTHRIVVEDVQVSAQGPKCGIVCGGSSPWAV